MEELVLTRGEALEMTKEELAGQLVRAQKMAAGALEKFEPANLFLNFVAAPALGAGAGLLANMGFDSWAQSQGYGSGFAAKYGEWLKSVPHTVIGGTVALTHIPSARTDEVSDALFAGGLGLAVPGAVRLGRMIYAKLSGNRTLLQQQAQTIALQQQAIAANQQGQGGQVIPFKGPFSQAG